MINTVRYGEKALNWDLGENVCGFGGIQTAKFPSFSIAVEQGDFQDRKTGAMGTQLARPPFRGAIGAWIYENISKQTFDDWIGMGTKIINELRLDLSRDEHDAVYDYAMRVYLGLTDEIYTQITDGQTPPAPDAQFKGVIDEIMARGGHLEDMQGQMHTRVED